MKSKEYDYAVDIARHLYEAHYKKDMPIWEPLDNLFGVLTQIDNMTVGLTKQPRATGERMETGEQCLL